MTCTSVVGKGRYDRMFTTSILIKVVDTPTKQLLQKTISTSIALTSNWNRPKRSGDKGPQQNYLKKLRKKFNKTGDGSHPGSLQ